MMAFANWNFSSKKARYLLMKSRKGQSSLVILGSRKGARPLDPNSVEEFLAIWMWCEL
jgi:hypothetical protein